MTVEASERLAWFLMVIFLSVLLYLTGHEHGTDNATRTLQREALKRDHAYWSTDTAGKPYFVWRDRYTYPQPAESNKHE
jgi:hypothetical protein